MGTLCFGASRDGVSPHSSAFEVPLRRIRCEQCSAVYVIWGNRNAQEEDKESAVSLLTELVNKRHPDHSAILCGSVTLDELRTRLGRKAKSAQS